MVSTNPLVSVIMPVLNGEQTIERSVQSVLRQTMGDFELLVVDDGSTDGTARVVSAVADHRCSLLAQSHAGVSAARNTGIAKANGRLVVFLDADDEVDERWLAHLAAPFDDPDVGLVCCSGVQREAAGGVESLSPHPSGELLRGYTVLLLAGAFMVRADVLAAAGGYAPLRYGENFELGFRITRVLSERHLTAAALGDELVRWFSDTVRSATRDPARLESAEYTLTHYGHELTRFGRALVHRVAAVNARRTGRRAAAVRHGIAAVSARPDRLENWRTLAGVVAGRSARGGADSVVATAAPSHLNRLAGVPLVSVLMPAFNASATLQQAIDSVLTQTFADLELVIVDDGSTDATPDILGAQTDPRIRVIRLAQNGGLVAALNRGLAEARGALVARLDADDVAVPGRLAFQVEAFDRQPDLVLCGCAAVRVSPAGAVVGRSVPPATHARLATGLVSGNRLIHSSTMFRRDTAVAVGGYAPWAYPAEDYHLWLLLMREGAAIGLPAVGVHYLVNPEGISAVNEERQTAVAQQVSPLGQGYPRGIRRVRRLSSCVRAVRRDLKRRGIALTGSAAQWRLDAFRAANGGRLTRWATLALVAPDLLLLSVLSP